MTETCYLAREGQRLRKAAACEQCFAIFSCKMYANYNKIREELLQAKARIEVLSK